MLLKIVPITVRGPRGSTRTSAVLDEGSTVTLIECKIAREVGATGPVCGLKIRGAIGMLKRENKTQRVTLTVEGDNGEEHTLSAYAVVNLALPHEQRDGCQPRILIGQDNARLIVSREQREEPNSGRIHSRTALGWVWHGGRDVGDGNADNARITATVTGKTVARTPPSPAVAAPTVTSEPHQAPVATETAAVREFRDSVRRRPNPRIIRKIIPKIIVRWGAPKVRFREKTTVDIGLFVS